VARLTSRAQELPARRQKDAGRERGTNRETLAFKPNPFYDTVSSGRAINDTIAAAICHGMLSRFPTAKLASVETVAAGRSHV
jgi:hypothetical protein